MYSVIAESTMGTHVCLVCDWGLNPTTSTSAIQPLEDCVAETNKERQNITKLLIVTKIVERLIEMYIIHGY